MSRAGALDELSREERLLLMRFVCSFAWATRTSTRRSGR
jgi:hypothetical protein